MGNLEGKSFHIVKLIWKKKNQNLGFKKENVSKSFKRFGNEFKLKEFQKGNIFKLFWFKKKMHFQNSLNF